MSQMEKGTEQARERAVVDETLFAHMQRLTVAERIALNDAAVRTTLELRAAFGEATQREDVMGRSERVGR